MGSLLRIFVQDPFWPSEGRAREHCLHAGDGALLWVNRRGLQEVITPTDDQAAPQVSVTQLPQARTPPTLPGGTGIG